MNKITIVLLMTILLFGCSSTNINNITLSDAKQIALTKHPGEVTNAKEIEIDNENIFEIDIINDNYKYKYRISTSGEIISYKRKDIIREESDDDDDATDTISSSTTITSNSPVTILTQAEIEVIAIDHTGGGRIVLVELDDDAYVKYYDVVIIKDNFIYELEINAITGKILEFERDNR